MDTAAVGIAQQEDQEEGIDEQNIFDRVVLFLAALTCRLCRRVLGADDAPLGAVMGKRGAAGVAVGTATPGVGSNLKAASEGTSALDARAGKSRHCNSCRWATKFHHEFHN
jgi:hypothetical protein